MSLRKLTKSRGAFLSDEGLSNLVYRVLMNGCLSILNRFYIQFNDRAESLTHFINTNLGHPLWRNATPAACWGLWLKISP